MAWLSPGKVRIGFSEADSSRLAAFVRIVVANPSYGCRLGRTFRYPAGGRIRSAEH